MKKNQVAVILINYNSADYTLACLKSIRELVDKNLSYAIIIVDNNSKTEDYENLENGCAEFENIQLIRSKLNLGFSGGNMLGVQFANADYLFFLNNDTVLLNDCLSILYRFMIANPKVGLCTGQMYNTDKTFHHSFNYFPTLSLKLFGSSLLRLFNPKKYPSKKVEYTSPLQVDLVTGAALFVDNTKFSEIGGFDTHLFLYCEEEDIAMQFKKADYQTFVVPEARFIHHMGKSTQRNLAIEKENYISLLYYHRKYNSGWAYFFLKLLCFFKILKKVYKHFNYAQLAFFILNDAPLKYSLKHKQKIRIENR